MNPMAWAVALLLAAAAFSLLEVFTPSMGILTFMAVGSAAGSCYAAFQLGNATGAVFVALNVLGIAGGFALGFKLVRFSPLAHRGADVEKSTYEPVDPVKDLAGASGAAHTDLRPGGQANFNGRKVDVVAEGGYIDRGSRIKVVRIEGTKVVVRKESV